MAAAVLAAATTSTGLLIWPASPAAPHRPGRAHAPGAVTHMAPVDIVAVGGGAAGSPHHWWPRIPHPRHHRHHRHRHHRHRVPRPGHRVPGLRHRVPGHGPGPKGLTGINLLGWGCEENDIAVDSHAWATCIGGSCSI